MLGRCDRKLDDCDAGPVPLACSKPPGVMFSSSAGNLLTKYSSLPAYIKG